MKFKVVIAEDNRLEKKNIKFVLDTIDECELVAEFSNGGDTLDYLIKNKADILLTDIKMPEMDGITLIRKLYDNDIDIEKIVISGYSDFDQAREIMGYDVSKYVMKPLVDNELEDAVLNAIRKRKAKYEKEDKQEALLRQVDKVRPVLIDNFFRNLILRPYNSKEYLKTHEQLLKIDLFEKNITVATISVLKKKETEDIYEFCALVSEFSEINENGIEYYPIVMSETEIAVVILHLGDSGEIYTKMIEMKNSIIEKYNIDILIGISQSTKNTDIVNILYNQSRSAVQSQKDIQKNVVVMYESCDTDDKSDNELFLYTLQCGLENVIKSNNEKSIKEFISEYVNMNNSDTWYRNFMTCYINLLEIQLNKYGKSFKKIIGENNIWQTLTDFDRVLNLKQYLLNLTIGVMHIIHQPIAYENEIVEQVKIIISKRFNERLSVNEIANELNFSRQHLHRIFVKVTGESILEYITRYRVDKAKEFLSQGMDINEVSEKVGYSDTMYFKKIFQDYTNMTIKEFLNKNK